MTPATAAPPATTVETTAPPSPAGPLHSQLPIRMPPASQQRRFAQTMRFVLDPFDTSLQARSQLGDVWQLELLSRKEPFVVTSHPDHVASLFKARPEDAPSLTGQSPLRPILGPGSVLTSVGARHMRQRKLLLPPFHGEAVKRYIEMILDAAQREIDRWPIGRPFALAPRMQAVTLDVIMGGVFGIGSAPARGTVEYVYPDPFASRPERFVDRKPGTYTWIPFGGGIRRCLGATLAMAEQRVVLQAIAQRTDLSAPNSAPERARQRNVTMIPRRGARVIVERKLS